VYYSIPAPTDTEGSAFGGLDLQPDGRIAVNSRRGIDLAGIGQAATNLANSGRLGNPIFAGGYIATLDDARKTLDLGAIPSCAATTRAYRSNASRRRSAVAANCSCASTAPARSSDEAGLTAHGRHGRLREGLLHRCRRRAVPP